MIGSTKIETGVTLVPQNTTTPSADGDLRYNSSTNKVELFNGAVDPLVTEADTATLTNKTLDTATNTITNLSNTNLNGSAGITNANLADMPALTVKANNTGSSALPQDVLISTIVGAGGGVTTVGTFDSQPASSNGLSISAPDIYAQSASASNPGMVNTTTQTMAGAKTFSTSVTSPAHISSSANPATSGVVQLANADSISWRNAGNTADLALDINSSNQLSVPVDLNINGHNIINTGTLTLPTTTDTLVGRATTDSLTNKTIGVSSAALLSNALVFEEIATPVSNPPSGELALYPKSTGQFYTLNSSGVETPIGSGSGGSKNYLSIYTASTSSGTPNTGNGNFELGSTTGWALGTIGTLTNGLPTGNPTFGSGASGNLSISAVSSGQLAGSYSMSYASSAATTQGNMVASSAFFIDTEDQAKVLTFKMYYSAITGTTTANWSGTSSNSFGVAIYDVTNSAWLSCTSNFGMTQSSGVGYVTGTTQTASNTTQLRFCMYNVNATSGAITLYLDDISVGPQTAPFGPTITDWVAYTPTFTGFGTPTAVQFQSRRVGANLEVTGVFTAGTTTATQARITLGFNGANSSVTTASFVPAAGQIVGGGTVQNVSTINFGNLTNIAVGSFGYILIGVQSSTAGGTNGANGSVITSSGDVVELFFSVPIQGWSSNVQMSSDTDTRVISLYATSNTTSAGTTSTPWIFQSTVKDTAGGYNNTTGRYTVPVSGDYMVVVNGALSSSATTVNVYRNASLFANIGTFSSTTDNACAQLVTGCNAGDILDIRPTTGTTLSSGSNLSIFRLSGPSVIAATESVNADYQCSGATTLVTGTITFIDLSVKEFDSHNAVIGAGGGNSTTVQTGWRYVVPVSGKYGVKMLAQPTGYSAAGTTWQAYIYHNTSVVSNPQTLTSATIFNWTASSSRSINCLAGDTIQVAIAQNSGSTQTISSNTYVSIVREGN